MGEEKEPEKNKKIRGENQKNKFLHFASRNQEMDLGNFNDCLGVNHYPELF